MKERFTCADNQGRLYTIVVFVTHRWVSTPFGPQDAVRDREYWLELDDVYMPVNIIRPLVQFQILDTGTMLWRLGHH